MRAAVMRGSKIVVDTLPEPEPQTGETLVRTLACGICGSDLHALKHIDEMVEAAREMLGPAADVGAPFVMDPKRDIVMGHEFCAEILDHGPNTAHRLAPGTRVVAMPVLLRQSGVSSIGYSNEIPGGYGERMVLMEPLLLPVPNGLSSERAALTEPMAVGLHAVAKARMEAGDSAIVVGCGPVGLAVIAGLRLQQIEPIVAADFSPMRRSLAERQGAHVVVDPNERSAFAACAEAAAGRPAAVFECVGVPGILRDIIREAPRDARVIVAGVCMQEDRIKPMVAIGKELSLQFVLGYSPEEFAQTLAAIAEGRIDVDPLITGKVALEGVADAFEELAHPDRHAKILVTP
jgi:threonine dehydrogenase-like Zn-dependent dehydrogenase